MNPAQFWGGAAAPYQIEQSLRFNSGDSAYLSRTPASAGNRRTWTWSSWVKRTAFTDSTSPQYELFTVDSGGNDSDYFQLGFRANRLYIAGYTTFFKTTNALYRDASAWYHVVVSADTDNATASDRLKIYVNGVRIESFNVSNNPSAADLGVNRTASHKIGQEAGTNYFDGYMSEVHFIDGQALDHEDFGEFDDNGVWRPIAYTGSYGTNGFYLTFDPSATNGIGHDHSGNGNNFTPSAGFVTSGIGTDVISDTPTNNWCTLNPLHKSVLGTVTATNGNLDVNLNRSGGNPYVTSTIPVPLSGKWYWEVVQYAQNVGGTMYGEVGVMDIDTKAVNAYGKPTNSRAYLLYNGQKTDFTTTSSYGSTVGQNVVVGVALDMDNGKIWFSRAGVWQASGDPAAGTNAAFTNMADVRWGVFVSIGGQTHGDFRFNFGQHNLTYTPPTDFLPLNTANLPAPDIADGSKYFTTLAYSGTSTTDSKVIEDSQGNDWAPDFVWLKKRNSGANHMLYDRVRGASKSLRTNTTGNEVTGATNGDLTAFTSTGFTLNSGNDVNASGNTYVAWNWLAGGSTSNIAAGSIDGTNPTIASTVSANPTAGFSIGTYTADGSNANRTVGHGLGVPPEFIIVKNRDTTGRHWLIWNEGFNDNDKALLFTDAAVANNRFGPSAPTSTVFGLYGGQGNYNSDDHVFYAFAGVEGYSKFGGYSGGDGVFVYLGFKPALLITKGTLGTRNWNIHDSTRSTFNVVDDLLHPHLNVAESAQGSSSFDFVSNGFVQRGGNISGTGELVIYAAFAEHPFGGSGVSPATAR